MIYSDFNKNVNELKQLRAGTDNLYGVMSQEEKLLSAISKPLGFEVGGLDDNKKIDGELARKLKESYVEYWGVLPYKSDENYIYAATNNPWLIEQINLDLENIYDKKIKYLVINSVRLKELTKLVFNFEGMTIDKSSASDDAESLASMANEAPVIRMVNRIFGDGIDKGASDIHIEEFEGGGRVRYRIDGELIISDKIDSKQYSAVISRIKILSNLDIAERRIPQDGKIPLKYKDQNFDIRVATSPSAFAETVVMRILRKSGNLLTLDKLGMDPITSKNFNDAIHRPNGIVLVSGPTGSGKTTTLYASLNELNKPNRKIITIEDPVEYQMDGIVQIPVNKKVGMTFAAALRSILRQDPNIVMVGEIRDKETAQIAVEASLTGHLVFSTIHTNSAAETITRLRDMGIENYLISAAMAGVLAQRLVRKLCVYCKKKTEKGLYQAVGCDKCLHKGYKGRHGIYEFLPVDKEIIAAVNKNATSDEIQALGKKKGMSLLYEDGLRLVKQGITTLEEVKTAALKG